MANEPVLLWRPDNESNVCVKKTKYWTDMKSVILNEE